MDYEALDERYESMPYQRCGASGLRLPALSLGLWHNFGDDAPGRTRPRSCAARSISVSPTSIWPTTMGHRTAEPRPTWADSWPRTSSGTETN